MFGAQFAASIRVSVLFHTCQHSYCRSADWSTLRRVQECLRMFTVALFGKMDRERGTAYISGRRAAEWDALESYHAVPVANKKMKWFSIALENCCKLWLLAGPPSRLNGKESTCQCRRCRKRGFDPWVGKISWGRKWQPRWYSCLGTSMDRGAWQATVQGGTMSQTRLKNKQQHGSLYVRLHGDYLPIGLPSFLDLNSKTRD